MDQQQSDVRDPAVGVPGVDQVVDDSPRYAAGTRTSNWAPTAGTQVGENEYPVRNRVQWGPIIAGALISLGTMIVLSLLGLAIGASAFEPGTDLNDWGTGAGIYGGISALISLFIGGWVAAKSAAVGGPYAGVINGLLAGIAVILGLIIAAAIGVDNAVGFLGANLENITGFVGDDVEGATFGDIEDGAWGTLIVLLLGLGAAALGGLLGHNDRRDLIEGTG